MKHLKIEQNNNVEIVSLDIIEKLYQISQGEGLDSTSDLIGNLQCTHAYDDAVTYLTTKFKNLQINVTDGSYIRFADDAVRQICATNWGDGTGITVAQAAIVTNLNDNFLDNANITTFNELSAFNNLTEITDYQFNNCTNLINIDTSKIKKIGQNSFSNCTLLQSVNLMNCTYLGDETFYNCLSLESLGDTSKIEYIGDYDMFVHCKSLKINVNLPNLTTLNGSFSGSGILNIISLGTVITLDNNFTNCKNLKTVILPETLTSITGQIFDSCSSLLWIKLLSETVVSLTNIWWADSTNSTFKIYVPDDLVESYKVATNWSNRASQIIALSTFV